MMQKGKATSLRNPAVSCELIQGMILTIAGAEKETGKRQRQAEREDTGSRSDSESSADDSSSSQQKHENKKRRKSRPSPEEKKKSSLAGMECPTMRAITKAALPAFRGMLVSLSPFPSSDERGELVDDSWVYALHKTKKKRTIDSEARSVVSLTSRTFLTGVL